MTHIATHDEHDATDEHAGPPQGLAVMTIDEARAVLASTAPCLPVDLLEAERIAKAADESDIWAALYCNDEIFPSWIAGAPGVQRQIGRSEDQARWKVQQLLDGKANPVPGAPGIHDTNDDFEEGD